MKSFIRRSATPVGAVIVAFILLTAVMAVGVINRAGALNQGQQDGRLITIHDGNIEKVEVSTGKTIGDALKQAGIKLDSNDLVEPATTQKLIAPDYSVNIYRAHPVIVIDGPTIEKIITPYQTADQIAQSAGITLYPEDVTILSTTSNNIVSEGAGLELTIHPATPFSFTLYGQTTTARTQAKTVGAMLKEKGITLSKADHVSPDQSTPITSGMSVSVWREGTQTITVSQPVPFTIQKIQDGDYNVGYHSVQTPGVNGTSSVTYQVTVQNGQEVSRTEIASIVTVQPIQEVEIVGVRSSSVLTKAMGVNFFTDSNGVTHRETYYNLNMSTVAQNCGNGGIYTIRADGVKVDRNGYILVAADLSRYPRCSVVETSLGSGMVYDTGGFVATYPDGFDIATDW